MVEYALWTEDINVDSNKKYLENLEKILDEKVKEKLNERGVAFFDECLLEAIKEIKDEHLI